MTIITIVDYGSGNIRSTYNALNKVKSQDQSLFISKDPSQILKSSHIIISGVGSFRECMKLLQKDQNLLNAIIEFALIKKGNVLGICVGMQIMATIGKEFGDCDGLNLIAGEVIKISTNKQKIKLPHVGFNDIKIKQPHPILKNIKSGDDFYFTHSYHFKTYKPENCLATTEYGAEISAIIKKDNIIGVQFHPEKSASNGLKLLSNFISS